MTDDTPSVAQADEPELPAEFLQPAEFRRMTKSSQRAKWRRWLDTIGVRYVCTTNGTPLVYRDRLLPSSGDEAAAPGARLNLGALDAPRRKAA